MEGLPIKTTDDLRSNLLAKMPFGPCDRGEIIAVTPLVKPAAEMWNRVVLVDMGDKFVVWYQIYPDGPNLQRSHFHQGSYFQPENYEAAMEEFGKRASRAGRSVAREAALRAYYAGFHVGNKMGWDVTESLNSLPESERAEFKRGFDEGQKHKGTM